MEPEGAKREPSRPASAAFLGGAVAILVLFVSLFAYHVRDCFVDDAFIGFQYIDNLLAGNGFVFHASQKPVEGVTNIGWLLSLLPLAAAVGSAAAAKTLGWLLLVVAIAATIGLGKRLAGEISRDGTGAGFGLTLVPAMLLASRFEFVYFPLAGMETALLAVALLSMAWVALGRPSSAALPALGAAAFLVHPEAAAVYPLYAALAWTRDRENRRRLFAGVIVVLILVSAITAARFAYFGDVAPNTFYSKPGGVRLAVQNACGFLMGQNTNVAFPVTGWLAIPLLFLGYRRLRRASAAAADMLAAIGGTGLLFAVYSPPDWTALPRYFAPYLPAALMLLWAGVTEAARLARCGRKCGLSAVALILLLTNVIDGRTKMTRMDEYPGYVLAGKSLIAPARWMDAHLPAEATVAARRIGALAYYSHRNVFDFAYGLPDTEVARAVSRHGGRFDTPLDPALDSLWRARAPDYLLEDNQVMDYIISLAGGVRERFAIHGIDYRVVREFPIGRQTTWVLAERR